MHDRRRRKTRAQAAKTYKQPSSAQGNRRRPEPYNNWPPRRIAAWALMLLGGLVAIQHLVAHLGITPIPLSMGWQDLLIGYPAAGLLLVAGASLLPRRLT